MEVPAHSHTPRKKWTHYLWEFLMLFLAVFCGFLAENFREHQVEHQREKQYMITLLEDLEADTLLLHATMKEWGEVNKSIDSVADAIIFPLSKADMAKAYRHINEALNYWSFTYNDRTIAQLKNSGGFRLIRNKKVANEIIAYDQFNNDAVKGIATLHSHFYENATLLRSKIFLEDIITEFFNAYHYDPVPYAATPWVDSLLNQKRSPLTDSNQTIAMFEFKNAIIALKRDYVGNMWWGYTMQEKMINELIKLISSEYHLK